MQKSHDVHMSAEAYYFVLIQSAGWDLSSSYNYVHTYKVYVYSRFNHARLVIKGERHSKELPWPPYWWLGMRPITSPCEYMYHCQIR